MLPAVNSTAVPSSSRPTSARQGARHLHSAPETLPEVVPPASAGSLRRNSKPPNLQAQPHQSSPPRKMSTAGGRRPSKRVEEAGQDAKSLSASNGSSSKRKRKKSKVKDPEASLCPQRRNKRWGQLFRYLDSSGDAEIDKLEFLTACTLWQETCPRIPEFMKMDLTAWDQDGNGTLCEGEFFTFCDALWQVIGEREFSSLEDELKRTSPKAAARRKRAQERAMNLLSESTHVSSSSSSSESEDGELLAEAVKMDVESSEYRERRLSAGALDHQNTEKLEAALKAAKGSPTNADTRKSLRKCINDSRTTGVDRDKVEEAVQLVRQLEVKEVLERAMGTNNPMILRVAILNIRTMGADQDAIDEAESKLAVLEIREKMEQAHHHLDDEEMGVLIVKAQGVGFSAEEVQEFRILKSQVEVIKVVTTAMKKKDPQDLEAALRRAKEEGMQDLPKVQEAYEFLPKLYKQAEAKKALGRAVCAGSAKDMRIAIDDAEHAGVEHEEIRRAHRILMKCDAREALNAAIAFENRGKLNAAIEKVEEAGLDLPEVEVAKSILQRLDANRELTLATDSRNVQELVKAVNKGRVSGVDISKLEKAELLLVQLQS